MLLAGAGCLGHHPHMVRTVDPHSFFSDPDPADFLNGEPNPSFFLHANSDPAAAF